MSSQNDPLASPGTDIAAEDIHAPPVGNEMCDEAMCSDASDRH
jgi:hypothetical protein